MTDEPDEHLVSDLRSMAEGDESVGNGWTARRLRDAADEIERLRSALSHEDR